MEINYPRYKYLALLFLIIAPFSSTLGQKPLPRITTAEEFLQRSPDVNFALDIITDTNGYVFFTGTEGVQRFNGRYFDIYDEKSTALSITFDKGFDDKIWCSTLKGKISYLNNGQITNFSLPDSVTQTWGKKFHPTYQTPDKTVHLFPRGNGYFTCNAAGEIKEELGKKSGYHGFFVEQLSDGKWVHYSIIQKIEKQDNNMSLYFVDAEKNVHLITEMNDKKPFLETSLAMQADSSLLISAGTKEIIRFKGKQFLERHTFDFFIIKLFVDSKNNLWIGTIDHGFFKVKDFDFSKTEKYWGGAAAVVEEDDEGGLWFRSDTGSFGYITPIATPHYSEQTGFGELSSVRKISPGKEGLIVQNKTGRIYLLNKDSLKEIKIPKIDHSVGVRNVYDYPVDFCFNPKDEKLWLALYGSVLTWDGDQWKRLDLELAQIKDKRIRQIMVLKNGDIMGATDKTLFTIHDDQVIPISESSADRINSFLVDRNGQIWVARQDGLFVLDNEKFVLPKNFPIKVDEENTVSFILEYGNEIWIQQHLQPLIRVSEGEISYVTHKEKKIMLKNYAFDPSGNLWGTSFEGNHLIKFVKNDAQLEITSYAGDYFLSKGKYRTSIVVTDKYIFNGTSYGLFKTAIKDLTEEKSDVQMVFSELRVNTKPIEVQPTYELNYDQNNLNITFDAISYKREPLVFSHKMIGIDSTWIVDNFENVQYTNLDPGVYQFLLRGRTKNGTWSEPVSIHFNIAKPYWKTWWFRVITLTLFVFTLYLIIRFRASVVRKKEKEKSKIAIEIAQLELRALKAQINPHFIFNSITSIMYYLSQKKADKAESYLERFSILIRKVLESSDENMVSIKSEVELMNHYITLESELFDGEAIEFQTAYKGFDPEKIKIPPTLLQPYIENAIWHGLKTKKGKRSICLNFVMNNDTIIVQITDNGIGRAKANERDNRSNHKSMGISISSRRIELLNQQKISRIRIEDLINEKGEATGTRVTFNTPFSQSA